MEATLTAYDDFDFTCLQHDVALANAVTQQDVLAADSQFYNENYKHGGLRQFSAIMVRNINPILSNKQPRLRGSATPAKPNTRRMVPVATAAMPRPTEQTYGGTQLSAPSSISSVFTSTPTRTRSMRDGIVVSGKEFISTVEGNGTSTFGLGKSALLSPAYFYGGVLGQLARSYTKYKWTKLIIHYIPKVSTATIGQIVLCSNENITFPGPVPESAAFLSKALVSGNGVMAPLWAPCRMQIPADGKARYIDAFTNVDINENIAVELLVYTQISVAAQVGYLWLEYECELLHNMLEPHSTSLPVSLGTGTRATLTTTSSTPTAAGIAAFTDGSSIASALPAGSVFRFVVDLQGSTMPTGTTAANWLSINVLTSGSSTTVTNALVGGSVYYLMLFSTTNLALYTSLEAAVAGTAQGQVVYRTTGSTSGVVLGDVTLVRLGVGILEDSQ